ncbi:hypothetical protein AFGD_006809 [Aspergillus flavus]|nr:hypothetical protein AFGD_006809 [Aspergillus flavus]
MSKPVANAAVVQRTRRITYSVIEGGLGNFHVHSDKDQELSAGQIAIEPRTNKSVCACGRYGIDVGTEGYLDLMDGDTRITTLHFDSHYQSNTNTFQAMETNNFCLVDVGDWNQENGALGNVHVTVLKLE